jgi:hypothetical protein
MDTIAGGSGDRILCADRQWVVPETYELLPSAVTCLVATTENRTRGGPELSEHGQTGCLWRVERLISLQRQVCIENEVRAVGFRPEHFDMHPYVFLIDLD